MTIPRVSVLTPLYNTNPDYLREMIESILSQTYKDFEFLLLNDSPDNKEIDKIVKSYKDKRIKYYKNDKNIGISESRNKLLDMARGEYIAIFDHDDISVPTRLSDEVAFLDANPEVGVVSSNLEFFGDKNNVSHHPQYDHEIKMYLTNDCFVAHTASMIRKSVMIDNNIKWNSFYTPAEDYHLWAQLMQCTHFHNLPQALVRYRYHKNNTSYLMTDKTQLMRKTISLEIRNRFPEYWHAFKNTDKYKKHTHFRIKLFGIPFIKINNDWIYIFGFIPMFKINRIDI